MAIGSRVVWYNYQGNWARFQGNWSPQITPYKQVLIHLSPFCTHALHEIIQEGHFLFGKQLLCECCRQMYLLKTNKTTTKNRNNPGTYFQRAQISPLIINIQKTLLLYLWCVTRQTGKHLFLNWPSYYAKWMRKMWNQFKSKQTCLSVKHLTGQQSNSRSTSSSMIEFIYTVCVFSCFRGVNMTSSNGNIFRVTGHLCGEITGHWWILPTKSSDAVLWCFLWSATE